MKAAPTVKPQRAKPPIGTPRKGQVVRALARAEANMQRGSAVVNKAQGVSKRNVSRAASVAGNLQLSKPGSAEARKAKAAYDRLNGKINKGEKTRAAAASAGRRLRALERAMTRGYGPLIARAKVRAGANKSLLESAPGDRIKGRRQEGTIARSRGRKARSAAAKKPAGWMQSPEARKDRVQQTADRKGYAKKLRALPKEARRAIQVERLVRRQKGIVVAGSTASQLTNIAEGRIRLIGNVGKRKDKLTPGEIGAMARTMSESARRLKVGMATGRRGRMRYNPNALQIATGTAARKIRGARVGGVARRVKPRAAKPQTFNDALKKANPAAYEKLQKWEAKVAKAQQRKAARLASRNGASAPAGDADARGRRSARLSGVSGRIAGRARRIYAQQGERVGAGTLPNRGLFAAPMGRRSTGTNAATSGLQPGRKVRGARLSGTIAKPRGMKPGAIKAKTKKTSQKALTPERIKSANANLKTRLTKVLDELRKVENAKNRDNSPMTSGSNFSPRYQKLIARGAKADRQLESLRKAAKKLKQIELSYTPEKYGFARGTTQRKALAAEIRKARGQLARLQREEVVAKKAYEESPVVKFGLWGEIGQNRRQSRKAKERGSARQTSLVDRYVGTSISIRKQLSAIQELRNKARQQTRETNKRQGSRRKP